MKRCILLALLLLTLTMAGCGNSAPDNSGADGELQIIEEVPNVVEELPKDERILPDTEPNTTFDSDEAILKYVDAYGADCVYADQYIPGKYILVGTDQVWIVYIMDGFENNRQMSFDSIARVESKSLGDVCFLNIVDKTGTEFSMRNYPLKNGKKHMNIC